MHPDLLAYPQDMERSRIQCDTIYQLGKFEGSNIRGHPLYPRETHLIAVLLRRFLAFITVYIYLYIYLWRLLFTDS
jgi:hypothetical protein